MMDGSGTNTQLHKFLAQIYYYNNYFSEFLPVHMILADMQAILTSLVAHISAACCTCTPLCHVVR